MVSFLGEYFRFVSHIKLFMAPEDMEHSRRYILWLLYCAFLSF